ncbi:preprotein translocase subunit SecE [Arthrobacter agilis]|uniref:preprotein translocase subunit SecE n=1 Tax=Arthrobacter agilis TaxID=37921 RepID=UPI000F6F9700|nr:preprotein translocase subunit SecE [Arthrobacter agilis]WDF32688.1 preprotein translocase subunit SecE [Arthrobacter agilis]VDR33044.1 preprotein translocase subunit SecE [Arthrobacter agilis]
MTDTAASSSKGSPAEKTPKRGFFGRIMLFIRQVLAELGKVVTPTRRELVRFTITVLIFVIIMMLLVTALDLVFGRSAVWVFGDS